MINDASVAYTDPSILRLGAVDRGHCRDALFIAGRSPNGTTPFGDMAVGMVAVIGRQ
jgi:hypothetical protein